MSDDNRIHYVGSSLSPQENERITSAISQLKPEDVEQFYRAYHYWNEQQRIEMQQSQIQALKQEIAANAARMQEVQPSAIALATLAQLQASGVTDVDLLDRMYERGDDWLDHTMQLLEHCERLDVIRGNYTEWCEHALEGAYDWLASIDPDTITATPPADTIIIDVSSNKPLLEVTEELLLQKLMSEEDTERLMGSVRSSKITGELPPLDEATEMAIAGDDAHFTEEMLLIEDIPASPAELLITEDVFEAADNTFTIEDVSPENSLLIEDTIVPLENAILPEDIVSPPDEVLATETTEEILSSAQDALPSELIPTPAEDTPETISMIPVDIPTEMDQSEQDTLSDTAVEATSSLIQLDDTPVIDDDEAVHDGSAPTTTDDVLDNKVVHDDTIAPAEDDTVQTTEDAPSPILTSTEVEELPSSITEVGETVDEETTAIAIDPVEGQAMPGLEPTQPLHTARSNEEQAPPTVPVDEEQKLDTGSSVTLATTATQEPETHFVEEQTVQTVQKNMPAPQRKRPGFFARLFAMIWGR